MARKSGKNPFDPQDFPVRAGKTISKYKKDQIIVSQGEVAHTVFYVQTGRVEVVVLSDQGKGRSSGFWKPASSAARDV